MSAAGPLRATAGTPGLSALAFGLAGVPDRTLR